MSFWTQNYWNDVPHYNYKSNSHNLPSWDKDAFWVYAGNYSNGYEYWDETYVWIPNIVRETPLTTAICSGPSATLKYTIVERTEISRGTARTNTYQNEVHNEVGTSIESGFSFFGGSASVKTELRSSVKEMSSNAIQNNWSNAYVTEERYEISTQCSGWETVQIFGLQMKMCAYRKKQGRRRRSSGPAEWSEPFLDYDFLGARWAEGKLFRVSYLQNNREITEQAELRKNDLITISDIIKDPKYKATKIVTAQ